MQNCRGSFMTWTKSLIKKSRTSSSLSSTGFCKLFVFPTAGWRSDFHYYQIKTQNHPPIRIILGYFTANFIGQWINNLDQAKQAAPLLAMGHKFNKLTFPQTCQVNSLSQSTTYVSRTQFRSIFSRFQANLKTKPSIENFSCLFTAQLTNVTHLSLTML